MTTLEEAILRDLLDGDEEAAVAKISTMLPGERQELALSAQKLKALCLTGQ